MPFDSITLKTSRHRIRKSLARDPTIDQIYENFYNFVDMDSLEFKGPVDAATNNAKLVAHNTKSTVRNIEIASRNE